MALDRTILNANVRIRTAKAGGSGTVIYAEADKDGKYSTYVLTNHHVVESNIKLEKKWNPSLKVERQDDDRTKVDVHFFEFEYEDRMVGETVIRADIEAYSHNNGGHDLALLKLNSSREIAKSVLLYPKGGSDKINILDHVVAIGCGMGNPPVVTQGRLSTFGIMIENKEFWLQTGATIFGNSGGAVYLEETSQFIGVPARIAVSGMLGYDAITHLSYMIPIDRVYEFLDEELYRFIYDNSYTEAGEKEARDERRKAMDMHIAAKIAAGEKADTENT